MDDQLDYQPDYQRLLNYFDRHQTDLLNVIGLLVAQETPSSDKERLDRFAEMLAERFTAVGAVADIVPNETRGNHLRLRLGDHSADNTLRQGLVLCHFDTVWPVGSLVTHPFRIDDEGRAYGPGIFDMQASLALCEFALQALRDLELALPRPLTILMTSDEEIGSGTSRAQIEEEARRADYALVMESPLPGGVLKTARKGVGVFNLTVRGRAAHAGVEPESGVSAVQELAHQVLALHSLNDYARGMTVNVGVVQGGTAGNVVAAQAHAAVDVRAWTMDDLNRLCAAVESLAPVTPGAKLELSGGINRPPLEHAVTVDLFARARAIGAALGLDLQEGSTGGGSDGSWTGALGVPTLDGLGVPGYGAHADHEHIEVDQIAGRAALLAALLLEL